MQVTSEQNSFKSDKEYYFCLLNVTICHYAYSDAVCSLWLIKLWKVANHTLFCRQSAFETPCSWTCPPVGIVNHSNRHGHTFLWCDVPDIHYLSLFFSASWRYWSSIFEYIQKKSRTCARILAAARPSRRSLVLSLSLTPFALSSLSSVFSHSLHVVRPLLVSATIFFLDVSETILWLWLIIVWPIGFTNTIV